MHRLGAIDAGAVTPARYRAAWTPCRVRADPAAAAAHGGGDDGQGVRRVTADRLAAFAAELVDLHDALRADLARLRAGDRPATGPAIRPATRRPTCGRTA